jgi:hypothetical protein
MWEGCRPTPSGSQATIHKSCFTFGRALPVLVRDFTEPKRALLEGLSPDKRLYRTSEPKGLPSGARRSWYRQRQRFVSLSPCQKASREDYETAFSKAVENAVSPGENNKRTKPAQKGQNRQGRRLKNQQDRELFLFSGTRGRRFKSSQARHLFNYLHAHSGPLAPYCGDFCGDPKPGPKRANTWSRL